MWRRCVRRRDVWDIEVYEAGAYEIALRRWPAESKLLIRSAAPPWTPHGTGTPDHRGYAAGVALPIRMARLRVGQKSESKAVTEQDQAAIFRLELERGQTELEAFFLHEDNKPICAAFFVSVQRMK